MASEAQRSKCGAAKYKVKFNNCWIEIYPVRSVPGNIYNFFVSPAIKNLTFDQQRIKDESHKECVEA